MSDIQKLFVSFARELNTAPCSVSKSVSQPLMNNLKLLNSAKDQAQPNILLDRLKAVWPIQFNEDDPKHHNDYQEP